MGDYGIFFHEGMGGIFSIWGYGCGWTDLLEMMGVGEDKFGVFF